MIGYWRAESASHAMLGATTSAASPECGSMLEYG
jgi:hypothetical protein